jgi:hypothetical protein
MRVLNAEPVFSGACDGLALSQRLQQAILALQSDFVRDDGRGVDYVAACASPAFAEFAAMTSELQGVEVEALGSEAERRCLFINLYNALTIHGLVSLRATTSPAKLDDFWNKTAYVVGKRTLTLNDIEHGILRGNGLQPAARTPHWDAADERVSLALPLEPRIHFALNCGAKSCPPIRVYAPTNLEFGLRAAAASFLENETRVEADGTVVLSSLLNWYGADFGATQEEVLAAVASYMRPESATRAALERVLTEKKGAPPGVGATLWNGVVGRVLPAFMPRGAVNVRYTPYDWALNAADVE